VPPLFHIASRAEWEAARADGEYRRSTLGQSLEEVGYVHCAFAEQVREVADAYYRGTTDLVLLELDPARIPAEVRVEALDGAPQPHPHVYGPLPVAAVVAVHDLPLAEDGRVLVPAAAVGEGA
jgi:glutathione S-transferase